MADLAARRSHTRHDRFAIAAALGGTALPATIATCSACGSLYRDLLSIRAALREAWRPRLHRDLRLMAADVALLRPTRWRRVLGAVGSSRDAWSRPLAVGLMGLGIAGAFVANLPLGFGGATLASTRPEVAMYPGISGPWDTDQRIVPARDDPDPLMILSATSLAAGGSIVILRRVASRARAKR